MLLDVHFFSEYFKFCTGRNLKTQQGNDGSEGSSGPRGPPGPSGIDGIKGIKGPAGQSFDTSDCPSGAPGNFCRNLFNNLVPQSSA